MTTDVERSKLFYLALGLELIVQSDHYLRFCAPEGLSTFSVHLSGGPIVSGTTVYFECDDLEVQVERLKAGGIAFEESVVEQPWLWREARLRDPDGNALCLYFAGENRLNPPWRVASVNP